MAKTFSSNDIPLADLLRRVDEGSLQLPDFQRGWVWDDTHIKSLLASISLSYPIGAVMTLETGNPDVRFAPRPLEGVECDSVEPDLLLLDGQQRLTSLFLALKSQEPVPTRDARGHEINRHYYANIDASINSNLDREEFAIISVPDERIIRSDFGRNVKLDLRNRDMEIAAEMFPLDIILDRGATFKWQQGYLKADAKTMAKRFEKWERFDANIIEPFTSYQIPVIQLEKSTTKEAVCQVFEKVNTGGVTLNVFELLTATYAADDFNLRVDWKRRHEGFEEYGLLNELQQTEFLQVVTLLSTFDKREHALAGGHSEDKVPGVSCKRREILRLPLSEYKKWADRAVDGLEKAVGFLRGESMYLRGDLPYASQLIPLGAIFGVLSDVAEIFQNRQKLSQWYWCGVLGELYGGSTDTRLANDIQDCIAWLEGGEIPRTVREAQFQADRLLTLRTRNSAGYKGLYALQMKLGAREFQSGSAIDSDTYADHRIDIHCVFPRSWCAGKDIEYDVANCIVNKTVFDAHTSRMIRGHSPSAYLRKIEKDHGMDSQVVDRIVRSHDIDPVALRRDDFESFFNDRFEGLIQQIERAMGKPVNRSEHADESPFSRTPGVSIVDNLERLIESGESGTLEFKSTGLKNLHTGRKDPKIEWAVVKSLCAFLNTDGGTLLVGVDDDKGIVGIQHDFPFFRSKNTDGWSRWLMDLIQSKIDAIATTYVKPRFVVISGKTIAQVDVKPSVAPVFARDLNNHQVFFIRGGSSTRQLEGSALLRFKESRFRHS